MVKDDIIAEQQTVAAQFEQLQKETIQLEDTIRSNQERLMGLRGQHEALTKVIGKFDQSADPANTIVAEPKGGSRGRGTK